MAISSGLLKQCLQKYFDPLYAGYEPPSSSSATIDSYGLAIDTYLENVKVIDPATVHPKDVQFNGSGCGDAFKSKLVLGISSQTLVYPQEIADGWEEMMNAIQLTAAGFYTVTEGHPITSITSVAEGADGVKAGIYNAVYALCQVFNSGEVFCSGLASILHSHTSSAFSTICRYSDDNEEEGWAEGPLVFG